MADVLELADQYRILKGAPVRLRHIETGRTIGPIEHAKTIPPHHYVVDVFEPDHDLPISIIPSEWEKAPT